MQNLNIQLDTHNHGDMERCHEQKALMTQREAAQYLGTSVGVLNVWRHLGKQKIPYVRWGNRIRYRKEDLDAWIQANLHNGAHND